jgi:broad specificity phosphatase PhoE
MSLVKEDEYNSDVPLSDVYLVRHGETEWSLSGQHTGFTDLPLTARGEAQACSLRGRLGSVNFAKVSSSPLQRAMRTCRLAGYEPQMDVDHDLVEWNYGDYEGKTRAQILGQRPDWIIFRDGAPSGESPDQIGTRADRVLSRIRLIEGKSLVFSSGHFLRVLIARWLGMEPSGGGYFKLDTATVTILGYDHANRAEPVIRLLNGG